VPKEDDRMTATTPNDSLATRASLLSRLRGSDNDASWSHFFQRYRDLIWRLARKAGLTETEADEALQETMLSLVRQLPEFRYDASKGSFKAWLTTIVRRRAIDQLRKRRPRETGESAVVERLVTHDPLHEEAWDQEWQKHLMNQATERTRMAVAPLQFQMFDLFALQAAKMADVKRLLRVSAPQVYMAKMRVGLIFRRELAAARREAESPSLPVDQSSREFPAGE
jgi:RNA polymerase sigma factor (sigma-70 family)